MRLEQALHLAPRAIVANPALAGTWTNELGSTMTLVVGPGGEISGTYQTAVGAPGPAQRFPLTGYASGGLIGFAVDFGLYGSLTSWVGHAVLDGEATVLSTMWQLAKAVPNPNDPNELWSSVLAGWDVFFQNG